VRDAWEAKKNAAGQNWQADKEPGKNPKKKGLLGKKIDAGG